MFWTLVLFAVSFVASALLAPKPKLENARAAKLSDFTFPRADEGAAVPLVLGRALLRGPNTLYYGGFRAKKITERIKTGLFSKKTLTVGHEYFLSFDMALCLGPVTVESLIIGDDDGKKKEINLSTVDNVVIEHSLGGPKNGGTFGGKNTSPTGLDLGALGDVISSVLGLVEDSGNRYSSGLNQVTVYPGLFDQPVDTFMKSLIEKETGEGEYLPAYRGYAHVAFKDFSIGEQPTLQQLGFVVAAFPDPLGLGSKNTVRGTLNAATALYYLLIHDWGGLGLSTGLIDVQSLHDAGLTLYDEGQGVGLVLGQSDQAKEFIDEVLRQIDGLIVEDAASRTIGLRLNRGGYDVDTLPSFDDDSTLEVVNFTRGLFEVTQNEVRVNWTSPKRNYQTATAFAQDMAAIGRAGAVRTAEFGFPACQDATLAADLASRELRQITTPLIKARLILNRKASTLSSGHLFKWSNSDYGVENIVFRIERADLGSLDDGRVAVDVIQDIFGVSETVFAAPEPGRYTPPSATPETAPRRAFAEAPRFIVERLVADGLVSDADAAILATLVGEPSTAHNDFSVELNGEIVAEEIEFGNSAVLAGAITRRETTLTVSRYDYPPTAGVDLRAGDGIVRVGAEYMQVRTATDNGDGTYDLDVIRSRFQSARLPHGAGTAVIWYEVDNDPALYEKPLPRNGAANTVKVLPRTVGGVLESDLAPQDSYTPRTIARLPNAPVISTPGGRTLGANVDTVTLNWKARDDRGRTDVLLPEDAAQPYGANEHARARVSVNGGGASIIDFPVGDVSGDVSFSLPQEGGEVEIELFGRETVNGWVSIESDLIWFDLPVLAAPAGAEYDPYFANVVLLMGFDDDIVADESPLKATTTPYGAVAYTGGGRQGSGRVVTVNAQNESSGYISVSGDSGLDLGNGDFTVETWMRSDYNNSTWFHAPIGDFSGSVPNSWCIFSKNGSSGQGTIIFGVSGGTALDSGVAVGVGAWHWVVVERKGDTTRIWVDGVFRAKTTAHNGVYLGGGNGLVVGGNGAGSNDRWRGAIDELRITKDVARYGSDADITVPLHRFGRSAGSTQWRIYPLAVGGNGRASIAEVDMLSGGASQVGAGAPSSPPSWPSEPVSMAFDSNPNTWWADAPAPSVIGDVYVQYDFPEKVNIDEVRLTARNDGYHAQTPYHFEVRYFDGVDWVVAWVAGSDIEPQFASGEQRAFTDGKLPLLNPGAEDGVNNWTVTGNFGTRASGPAPAAGSLYFFGGDSASSSAQQTVAIPATEHAGIDAGSRSIVIDWKQASYSGSDRGGMEIDFLDSGAAVVGTIASTVVTITPGQDWQDRSLSGVIPAGTRSVIVRMKAQRSAGSNNDAYFDELKLSITT